MSQKIDKIKSVNSNKDIFDFFVLMYSYRLNFEDEHYQKFSDDIAQKANHKLLEAFERYRSFYSTLLDKTKNIGFFSLKSKKNIYDLAEKYHLNNVSLNRFEIRLFATLIKDKKLKDIFGNAIIENNIYKGHDSYTIIKETEPIKKGCSKKKRRFLGHSSTLQRLRNQFTNNPYALTDAERSRLRVAFGNEDNYKKPIQKNRGIIIYTPMGGKPR